MKLARPINIPVSKPNNLYVRLIPNKESAIPVNNKALANAIAMQIQRALFQFSILFSPFFI